MFRNLDRDDRAFLGKRAIAAELAGGTSRWKLVGVDIDWRSLDAAYTRRGLVPSRDHVPIEWELMVYAEGETVGFSSSFMYSPILQRHICLARVPPQLSKPGTTVQVEVTIDHYNYAVDATVSKLPFFDPPRRRS